MEKNYKKTILIVDDEQWIFKPLKTLLEERGYRVLTASDGESAYQKTFTDTIDVVVSDVVMKNGNGIELLEKIRINDPFTPLVILTSGYQSITEQDAKAKGALCLLLKPFTIQDLIDKIELI